MLACLGKLFYCLLMNATNSTIHGSTLHITKSKRLEVGTFISTWSNRADALSERECCRITDFLSGLLRKQGKTITKGEYIQALDTFLGRTVGWEPTALLATRIWDLYAKAPSIDCRSRLDGSQVAF